jgi:hypothetical protein
VKHVYSFCCYWYFYVKASTGLTDTGLKSNKICVNATEPGDANVAENSPKDLTFPDECYSDDTYLETCEIGSESDTTHIINNIQISFEN